MALVLITLQDEQDGTVNLGFTSDPVVAEAGDLSDAQILGMMAVHTVMTALAGEQEETAPVE